MKQCRKCRLWKESTEFYKQKDTVDRLHAYCKPCHNRVRKEAVQRNLERHRAMRRAYAKRPEVHETRMLEQRLRRLRKKRAARKDGA